MKFEDDEAIDQQLVEMELYESNLEFPLSDIKSNPNLMASLSPAEFCLQYMGLYLLKGDLVNAKFLHKRLPQSYKDDVSMKSLWHIAQLLWQQDMKTFFASTKELLSKTSNTSDMLYYIIQRLRDRQLKRLVNLICQAYSSISIDFICNLFDMQMDEVLEMFSSKGWSLCSMQKFLCCPKETQSNLDNASVLNSEDSLNTNLLSKLSEIMCFMENH